MTVLLIAAGLLAAGVLIAAVGALIDRFGRRRRGRGAHRRPLPHRPAPDAPPVPGPRHRIDDAHTASYSAAAVLERQRAEQLGAIPRPSRRQRIDAGR